MNQIAVKEPLLSDHTDCEKDGVVYIAQALRSVILSRHAAVFIFVVMHSSLAGNVSLLHETYRLKAASDFSHSAFSKTCCLTVHLDILTSSQAALAMILQWSIAFTPHGKMQMRPWLTRSGKPLTAAILLLH